MSKPVVNSFGPVAPFYDELMRTVPYRMWVGYYLLLLSQMDAHPKSMLDVCCGTGTMCEMLHAERFALSGFDLSPGMIEVAQRKAAKKGLPIDYFVADASTFELNRVYDSAYSFFDSLNNILNPGLLQDAMKRVFEHLRPGGSFVFDLNTAYAFEARLFDQENLKGTKGLRYKWVGDWDPKSRVITVDMRFWRGDEEFVEVHRQRAHDDDEIRSMLATAGFREVQAYHSYTLDPPRFKSDRVHYTAIRPR